MFPYLQYLLVLKVLKLSALRTPVQSSEKKSQREKKKYVELKNTTAAATAATKTVPPAKKSNNKTASNDYTLPDDYLPERLHLLVHRITQNGANEVDPGFCTQVCPFSTGSLPSQRWELLKRLIQVQRVIERTTRTCYDLFAPYTFAKYVFVFLQVIP